MSFERPSKHPRISYKEKVYIEESLGLADNTVIKVRSVIKPRLSHIWISKLWLPNNYRSHINHDYEPCLHTCRQGGIGSPSLNVKNCWFIESFIIDIVYLLKQFLNSLNLINRTNDGSQKKLERFSLIWFVATLILRFHSLGNQIYIHLHII